MQYFLEDSMSIVNVILYRNTQICYKAEELVIKLKRTRKFMSKNNKINEIKLYLADYYADEWEVENNNFTEEQKEALAKVNIELLNYNDLAKFGLEN